MRDVVLEKLEEALRELREKYEGEKRQLEDAIAGIKQQRLAINDKHPRPDVVPREFEGMEMTAALVAYLNRRGGGPESIARAAVDLAVAGVALGNPDRHERNLKICISNNLDLFEYYLGKTSVKLRAVPVEGSGRNLPRVKLRSAAGKK
jgi:hypothetical protein